LVEVMVAVVIGLVAVLVIYQTFAVSEGYRRNTTGASDAQSTGLFSMLTAGVELANAGNAVSVAAEELSKCRPFTTDPAATFQPIPVLITAGASDDAPDAFVVTYSTAANVVVPVQLLKQSPAPNKLVVQSPNGFAVGSRLIAIQQSTGKCAMSIVANRSPKLPPAEPPKAGGETELTLTTNGGANFTSAADVDPARVLDMGPAGSAHRVLFDIVDGTLRTTDLLTPNAAAVPIAGNVVNMKLQYGVDTTVPPDDIVDEWVPATGIWERDTLLAPAGLTSEQNLAKLRQIKAIRIGLIVRSAQFDRDVAGTTPWTLFDCPAHDDSCQGRLTGALPANWRYRTYETVIPLRNQLWNGAT
jgi:type IV pilus assembly protein PilW